MADFLKKGGFDTPVISTGHAAYVRAVVVHPESNRVFSASGDGTMRAWDTETGRCHRELKGHRDAVRCLGCWRLRRCVHHFWCRVWWQRRLCDVGGRGRRYEYWRCTFSCSWIFLCC